LLTRRAFLGRTLAALAAGAAASGASRASRPNVLFVIVDDLNAWIGCLGGHPDARTPSIDALAARGVAFGRAYCNAPACNPSRVSLFTGLRPSTSGVYDNQQPFRRALPRALTLQQQLMAHGYRVVGRGKVFHGGHPDPQSWSEYLPKGPNPAPPSVPQNGIPEAGHFDWGPLDVADDEMDDMKVVAWCAERLGRRGAEPLFLACGLNTPHLPWYVPRSTFERFDPEAVRLPRVLESDLDDVPPAGRRLVGRSRYHRRVVSHGAWGRAVAAYLASIAFVDKAVGRLVEAFDRSPYRDDTAILLTSDQGFHLGEKLHWRKFALWEEATRVPLVCVPPGGRTGARCGRPVSLLDLYPTLCELCGVPGRPELEGVSLAPLLADPERAWPRPAVSTEGRGNHSVRSERWRLIRYADGSEELYDHERDADEWHNLASRPEHATLKRQLAAWLPGEDAPDAPRSGDPEAPPPASP